MRVHTLVAAAVAVAVSSSLPAEAQTKASPRTDGRRAEARTLADRGFEHYQAQRYDDALAAFREAVQVYRAPTVLLMLARTQERLGKLVEAQAAYEAVLFEPLAPTASKPFRDAKQQAQEELTALEQRIPRLKVVVTGAPDAAVTIAIDGVTVPATGQPMSRNPGRTRVVVSAPAHRAVERVVLLEEGRTAELSIVLGPSGAGVTSQGRGSLLPAGLAFGLGGLGLGIGTVTGILAKVEVDDIRSRCNEAGHCPRDDKPRAEQTQSLITASTVGFVVGGVATALGVTLLVLRPGGEKASSTQEAAQTGAMHVVVGPGMARIEGTF
ncbi:tetratricopeptide repeat protein [Chondromyces crocatus]|uniref:PEGA domain-containing protein n=1 Tax=Chondromyces crocatus TaxID=52 RepID=A0A0K1EGZ2_CHOCO|nr:hypothetical protein [Chondromyces crocatus]AKT40114.1 uncharacterized protein CMC5_042670 [Chondromyces crocatus]